MKKQYWTNGGTNCESEAEKIKIDEMTQKLKNLFEEVTAQAVETKTTIHFDHHPECHGKRCDCLIPAHLRSYK